MAQVGPAHQEGDAEPVLMEPSKELQLTREMQELWEPGGLSLEFHFWGEIESVNHNTIISHGGACDAMYSRYSS